MNLEGILSPKLEMKLDIVATQMYIYKTYNAYNTCNIPALDAGK